jgi:hypothetical protein
MPEETRYLTESLPLVVVTVLTLRLLRLLVAPGVQAVVEQLTLPLGLRLVLGERELLDRETTAELLLLAVLMAVGAVAVLLLLAATECLELEAVQEVQVLLLL